MKKFGSFVTALCVIISMLAGSASASDVYGYQGTDDNISVTVSYIPLDEAVRGARAIGYNGKIYAKGTVSTNLFTTTTGDINVQLFVGGADDDTPFIVSIYNANGTCVQTATVLYQKLYFAHVQFSNVPSQYTYYISVENPNNKAYDMMISYST